MSAPIPPPRRILVVDDEPQVCEAVKMLLEFDGHTVITAGSGQEALQLLTAAPFDLVITDYSMPQMKGDELAKTIKARYPNQPVIMVTAYAEILESTGKPVEGVDLLISKPFMLEDFRSAVLRTTRAQ